jgi:hypothetical protein
VKQSVPRPPRTKQGQPTESINSPAATARPTVDAARPSSSGEPAPPGPAVPADPPEVVAKSWEGWCE